MLLGAPRPIAAHHATAADVVYGIDRHPAVAWVSQQDDHLHRRQLGERHLPGIEVLLGVIPNRRGVPGAVAPLAAVRSRGAAGGLPARGPQGRPPHAPLTGPWTNQRP